MPTVATKMLERLREWGIHRLYGYPGDGINGFLGGLEEVGDDPFFVQTRHEEMAAFMACAHAKFTGEIGACMATSGPGAVHLINGLYDAKLDHVPVLAIVGQQKRHSVGAHYQQEVDLQVLFKDVGGFVTTVMDQYAARHVLDRAIKSALTERRPAIVIVPEDVQEADYADPPRQHGSVYSCLACKGCTNDCPVNVDMPTYKAEFLYHHYKSLRRWRPRYAYAFGFIDQASRLASRFPELANAATQAPLLSTLAKALAGVDRARSLPRFAPMTLQSWFEERGGPAHPSGKPVVLFPDTFNNRLHTNVGVACVEAIEAAGWQVVMPQGHLCCGRPLYDYGFLDHAERYLRRVVTTLAPYAREGVPIVGMEPSCLAVFRDELTKMLPHDDDAARVAAHAEHFGEFFERHDVDVPKMAGRALLWGHCHHRATGGIDTEGDVLRRMGLDPEQLTGGCCGLAGSWGFEHGKYEISMACGEEALLPAVRKADSSTVVVANGFSCKTQIEGARAGRRALHLGEVMAVARALEAHRGTGGRPETLVPARGPAPSRLRRVARVAGPAAAAALGAAGAVVARRR